MMSLSIRVLLASLLLLGCSSSESAPLSGAGGAEGTAGETSSSGEAGTAASRPLTGTITLSLKPASEVTMTAAFSVAGGTVYDGVVPEAFPLAVAQEEQGCQLLKPALPFCSAGCGGDAACVDDETCAPYPKAQNVGVLQLEGLGRASVTMEPFPPGFAYQSQALPHPPCEEGEPVRLSADGFSVATVCIAPLVVSTAVFPVQRGQALDLTWEAPAKADQTSVSIKLDVSHHGGKKGEIDCDVPDTGAFEIPAALVTALVDLGLAGYPTIVLTRRAKASSSEQPAISFAISSSIEREVDTGVTSCTEDVHCPTGQQCNTDKLTCE
jgi:hypothetical protein